MQVERPTWVNDRLNATPSQIAAFCQRWHITEFALFGSVLRDDFRPDSDIDVLVTFPPNYQLTWDARMNMQEEIEDLCGRKVDLVNKHYLNNPYRRSEILETQQVIYTTNGC